MLDCWHNENKEIFNETYRKKKIIINEITGTSLYSNKHHWYRGLIRIGKKDVNIKPSMFKSGYKAGEYGFIFGRKKGYWLSYFSTDSPNEINNESDFINEMYSLVNQICEVEKNGI